MSLSKLLPILSCLALLAVAGSCRDQGGTFNPPRPDAGTTSKTCNTTADCGGTGVCISGICESVRSCTNDNECAGEGKVCHSRRFYCVECDGTHANECAANETCQFDFTCVPIGGGTDAGTGDGATACHGSCTDKSMCGTDEVCKTGACCPPPARCFSQDDCPASRPECNGANGMCFGGTGCFSDTECDGQPGCAQGACFCDGGPPGTCRLRADSCQSDADCLMNGTYAGKFCLLSSPPKRCVTAPTCTSDADCAQSGLVCDLTPGSPSINHCKNGTPCPNGNECNPTTETCVNGVCALKNCINTPSLCTATEVCNQATGQCVPMMSGACTVDTDCQAGYWCNVNRSPAACEVGCRTSADCAGGVCNANHQCQGGMMGQTCGPCMTDADCPGGQRCVDTPIAGGKICHETCSTILMTMCTDANAQCLFTVCTCFL